MKKTITFLLLLIPAIFAFTQDTLVLKDGTESLVKVIEIDGDIIKYKKHLLPEGPSYKIATEMVFMIFYKGGLRELVKSNILVPDVITDKNKTDEKNNTSIVEILRDEENGWELKLSEQTLAPDKKRKWLEYSAVISVYKNGNYITAIGVACNQQLKKMRSPGERIDKSFLNKSFIVFAVKAGEPFEKLLFEKYENYGGKGLGWGVDWDFLKSGVGSCSIKHFNTITDVLDIKWKTVQDEYRLKDCTTVERRVLSAAIIWLDINLSIKTNKANR